MPLVLPVNWKFGIIQWTVCLGSYNAVLQSLVGMPSAFYAS